MSKNLVCTDSSYHPVKDFKNAAKCGKLNINIMSKIFLLDFDPMELN